MYILGRRVPRGNPRGVGRPAMKTQRCPDIPYQPGDGDRKAKSLRSLRRQYGLGPLAEDLEPDVLEMMQGNANQEDA